MTREEFNRFKNENISGMWCEFCGNEECILVDAIVDIPNLKHCTLFEVSDKVWNKYGKKETKE